MSGLALDLSIWDGPCPGCACVPRDGDGVGGGGVAVLGTVRLSLVGLEGVGEGRRGARPRPMGCASCRLNMGSCNLLMALICVNVVLRLAWAVLTVVSMLLIMNLAPSRHCPVSS